MPADCSFGRAGRDQTGLPSFAQFSTKERHLAHSARNILPLKSPISPQRLDDSKSLSQSMPECSLTFRACQKWHQNVPKFLSKSIQNQPKFDVTSRAIFSFVFQPIFHVNGGLQPFGCPVAFRIDFPSSLHLCWHRQCIEIKPKTCKSSA